jgi:hypothetical protein
MDKLRQPIQIDKDLLKQFKIWCVTNGVSMKEVIEKYIKKLLKKEN